MLEASWDWVLDPANRKILYLIGTAVVAVVGVGWVVVKFAVRRSGGGSAGASGSMVAGHDTTMPPAALARLATDPKQDVRWAAAGNPATPPEALARLAEDPDKGMREQAAGSPATPPEALARLTIDPGEGVRERAAGHPATPPEALARLAEDPNRRVRRAVAENPAMSPGAWARLADDPDTRVRRAAAGNPATPPEALARLATDPDEGVRERAAGHPATPPEALARLAADPDTQVRWVAAGNPATPPEALARLAADPDEGVREQAAGHPATPPEALARLAADPDEGVREQAAVGIRATRGDFNYSDAQLHSGVRKHPWGFEEAAQAQDVRFTIYHPKEIAHGLWDTLLVYAHIPEVQEWVQTDSQSRVERSESHGRRLGRETRSIPRGAEIRVVPELPGCQFNPPDNRFLWLEDAHRCEFRVQADPEVPGFALGAAVNGRLSFYIASLLIAEITIWAFIADQTDIETPIRPLPPAGPSTPMNAPIIPDVQAMPFGASQGLSEKPTGPSQPSRQPVMAAAAPYSAIFASYAHDDSNVVERFGARYKVLGMSFPRDQEVLRSGEKWNPRLLDLIERADIFQLYWSHSARQSRYVRREWRRALHQQRDNFIRPMYWQKPMPKPPRELKDPHFAYLSLEG